MRNGLAVLGIITLAMSVGSACASKGFVRTSVGEVNNKVESLETSLEQTQEQTRQNAGRIGEVDQKAAAADQKAAAAGEAAVAANRAAEGAKGAADAVGARAEELEKASRRLVYEVVLSEDQGNFKFAKTDLPEEAKGELDKLVQRLKSEQRGVFIEIEGHTDSVGPEMVNERVGLERAEAVKRYLYEQHQIPLHKMNVISYGEAKPAAPNNTRAGRAQNRRVVVKVLA